MDDINPHPGFAMGIFVSWDDIADYFGLPENWDIYQEGDSATPEFVELAFTVAQDWTAAMAEQGNTPDDELVVEKENEIIKSLQNHWSTGNIFLSKFSFEQLIADTNEWSHHGAQEAYLFGNVPNPGKSLEYFLTNLGINFTVYEPFMIPYTEIYYHLYDGLPEWNYDEIEGMDIIETIFAIQDKNGIDTEIDLDNWASIWRYRP